VSLNAYVHVCIMLFACRCLYMEIRIYVMLRCRSLGKAIANVLSVELNEYAFVRCYRNVMPKPSYLCKISDVSDPHVTVVVLDVIAA
jgi:hypothetical protein